MDSLPENLSFRKNRYFTKFCRFVEESQNAWVEAVEGNVENDIRQLSRLQKR